MQGTLWTEEEMKLVNDITLSDAEVAKKVNRTTNAVKLKRYYIKKTSSVKKVAKKEKETNILPFFPSLIYNTKLQQSFLIKNPNAQTKSSPQDK